MAVTIQNLAVYVAETFACNVLFVASITGRWWPRLRGFVSAVFDFRDFCAVFVNRGIANQSPNQILGYVVGIL